MGCGNGTSNADRFAHDPEMLEALAANSRVPLPIVGKEKPRVTITHRRTLARSLYTPVMRFLVRWSKMGFLRASSQAIATTLAWFWGWGFQIVDFASHYATIKWFTGEAEYDRRMAACADCPIVRTVEEGPKAGMYCGACGCPKWRLSNLASKNWLRKHHCPAGFHGLGEGNEEVTDGK